MGFPDKICEEALFISKDLDAKMAELQQSNAANKERRLDLISEKYAHRYLQIFKHAKVDDEGMKKLLREAANEKIVELDALRNEE